MKNKILFKLICIFLVSTAICVFCIQSVTYKSYIVPGTVVSKDTEQYAHGKNYRNMSTRYVMCIKPNDTNKFKHYSLYVNYTTYCTHNIGDKIAFSVSEDECIKDFKRSEIIEAVLFFTLIMFGILSIFSFVGIITVIVEPYLDKYLF